MAASSAQTAQQIKILLKPVKDEKSDAARLDELRRLFGQLLQRGEFTLGGAAPTTATTPSGAVAQKWRAFLLKSFHTMVTQLQRTMEQDGRKSAVRTLFGVVAACPVSGAVPYVNATLLEQWLKSLTKVQDLDDKALRSMVQGEFLLPYRDVQYYAWVAIAKLAKDMYQQKQSGEGQHERLFQLLLMIPIPTNQKDLDSGTFIFTPPKHAVAKDDDDNDDTDEESDQDDDEQETSEEEASDEESEQDETSRKRKRASPAKARTFAFEQIKAHRKALSNAWLAILKLNLPTQALKQALVILPQALSQVPEPLRFADFFMQAFDNRGVLPVLALDGLFSLMTEHNLEYPVFYASLYSLLQPSLLYVKYRTRFFELLTKCLVRNQMLPAHIVASFCKRLLRISLSAPPPSILFCLALTGNLLRKHPECACLIHRSTTIDEDAFDAETDDPTQTRALESSLWELHALANHYYPSVTTLAKAIGTETATTPMYELPDFLAHTYKSLFDQERKQQSRRKVALTFHEPKLLFGEHDVLTGIVSVPTSTASDI
jgi:U3 small nucleolar RNA-associated protein 19